MKCFVTLNNAEECVITRVDSQNSKHSKRVVSRSEFVNFWYRKVHTERLIRDFYFMTDDSFFAAWIEIDDKSMRLHEKEGIFILSDSICDSGIRDYLRSEIEEAFHREVDELRSRCDAYSMYFTMVERNRSSFIEALRKFDETGSIEHIEELVPIDVFAALCKLFKKDWCKYSNLFSTSINSRDKYLRFFNILSVVFVGLVFNALMLRQNIGSTLYNMSSLLFTRFAMYFYKKAINESVIEKLRKTIGEERFDEADLSNAESYEKSIDIEQNSKLLDITNSMTNFMRNNQQYANFFNEAQLLREFLNDIGSNNLENDFTLRFRFMIRLLDIEERIYSRDENKAFDCDDSEQSIENLIARLEFIGFKDIDWNDEVMNKILGIYSTIDGKNSPLIVLELTRIHRLVINYMMNMALCEEQEAREELVRKSEAELASHSEKISSELEKMRLMALRELISELSSSKIEDNGETPVGMGQSNGKRIALKEQRRKYE